MLVKRHFQFIIYIFTFLILFCTGTAQAGNKENYVGQQLPVITFQHPDGTPVTLDAFKGRIVLVNVWASWCPPCVAELDSLDRLQAMLRDKSFSVVTISVDRGPQEKIQKFWDKQDLPHLTLYRDTEREIVRKWSYEGIPVSFLLDRHGNVIRQFSGPYEWHEGKTLKKIEAALK